MELDKRGRVVFQPETYQAMQKGIAQIVEAVRPTLGPLPRYVAVDRPGSGKMPELLDNGALISKRVIALNDRDEDMGAMFVRGMLWKMDQEIGDGTATAAVLFRSVFDQGVRYIVSGGNAMLLRKHLEHGARLVLDVLSEMAIQVTGKDKLAQIAHAICHDQELATMLGEIFDIIGEDGHLEIRSSQGRGIEREYVEGAYWKGKLFSRQMINDFKHNRARLEDAAICISDLEIDNPQDLIPLLEMVLKSGMTSLVIVAKKLSESAIALLLSNKNPDSFQTFAVHTPGVGMTENIAAMDDLVVLAGGRPISQSAGDTLHGVKLEDLGRARRAWADNVHFGIIGGKGNPRMLRQHVANLRASYEKVDSIEERRRIRHRIGMLLGGSAALIVGGVNEIEIDSRKDLARRTANAMRCAVREGVLPGGGAALLACQPVLEEKAAQSSDLEERIAYRILKKAVEVPIRTILYNAGYDASEIMAEIKQAGLGNAFDVHQRKVDLMAEAGIYDVSSVIKEAAFRAITSAALALTTDVLIHHKNPEKATTP